VPWSTKAFVRTVQEIEHHEVVNSGQFADEFEDKSNRIWTKTAIKDLESATESYMVKVGLRPSSLSLLTIYRCLMLQLRCASRLAVSSSSNLTFDWR
jgi:hypothetical protein